MIKDRYSSKSNYYGKTYKRILIIIDGYSSIKSIKTNYVSKIVNAKYVGFCETKVISETIVHWVW